MRDRKLGLLLALGLLASAMTLTAASANGVFSDDDGSIFEAEIEALAAIGVTKGCNPPVNDRFCPDDYVTRAQMATFLARLLELVDGGSEDLFMDDDSSVHRTNIDRIAAAGITYGCNPPDNDRFCPNEFVTRGQMAAFLVRALLLPPGGSIAFVDDDSSVFESDIESLAAAGITRGCNPPDNNRFCADEFVTRGQMAAFIMRALRRDPLLVRAQRPFIDDPHRDVETDLDRQTFQKINDMECPTLLDREGWFVEARTGGRPFMTIDTLNVDGKPSTPEPCTAGSSGIAPAIISAHYEAGKGVNRLWIGHQAGEESFPIVVVITSDGFINLSGAEAPLLAGGALRLGFIGQPFDDALDYVMHIDELSIDVVDSSTLTVSGNVYSEIGEGAVAIEVTWDDLTKTPNLDVTARSAARSRTEIGFAGINFMRGPTLHGIVADGSMAGIEAFHDARTAFFVHDTDVQRDWLVPPLDPDSIARFQTGPIQTGTTIIVDQPQNITGYFSKSPGTPYEHRADLILEYGTSNRPPVSLNRAQTAVDLDDPNPEANETVNLFFANEQYPGPIFEHSYTATVAANDFADAYRVHPHGVVFVSGGSGAERLHFLLLDKQMLPVGDPIPLTDSVIVDPHSPHASPDGRQVLFDADDYGTPSGLQRIYELDMGTAAVRRLTVDPFGTSTDHTASLSGDGSRFSFITNRSGVPEQLVIEETATGLASGFGNVVTQAHAADWCGIADVIAFTDTDGVHLLDVDSAVSTTVHDAANTGNPSFNPDCTKIAFENDSEIWMVDADGAGDAVAIEQGRSPSWAGDGHLLVEMGPEGSADIYLLNLQTQALTNLTGGASNNYEPTYLPAVTVP